MIWPRGKKERMEGSFQARSVFSSSFCSLARLLEFFSVVVRIYMFFPPPSFLGGNGEKVVFGIVIASMRDCGFMCLPPT